MALRYRSKPDRAAHPMSHLTVHPTTPIDSPLVNESQCSRSEAVRFAVEEGAAGHLFMKLSQRALDNGSFFGQLLALLRSVCSKNRKLQVQKCKKLKVNKS